jgi:hypothetical protein
MAERRPSKIVHGKVTLEVTEEWKRKHPESEVTFVLKPGRPS